MSYRTPSKKQRKWYSGKKKRHTIKAQVIVNRANGIIICTAEDFGKTHDFALYKNTIDSRVLDSIKEQADSGYQGISEFHRNSETPKKKPKGRELTDDEKGKIDAFLVNVFLLKTSMRKLRSLRL